MNCKMTKKMSVGKTLLVMALVTSSSPVLSAEYWLKTGTQNVAMPDGVSVPMWGFALCDSGSFAVCGLPSVPGPALAVLPGDTSGLTVHLQNTLPEPVSMVINGQTATMTPVWTDGTSGPRSSANQRVRSFTHEAAATNGEATYNWPAVKNGTYLYQSGTHPQVQVQMGLYGALTSDALAASATNNAEAYTGIPYSQSVTMLLSEVDPALHASVANGTYGTANGPTSTLNYEPKYFLINGKAFAGNQNPIASVKAGDRTLLRFLNAGLRTHVPMINDGYLRLVAEDGNAYPWSANPRSQYTVFLPAAKTIDAVFVGQTPAGTDSKYAIFDRRLSLNNNASLDGGMLTYLSVTNVGTPPVINAPAADLTFDGMQRVLFTSQVVASDPDGGQLSYSLQGQPAGMTISALGLVSWTPAISQVGLQTATVRVTDPTGQFVTRAFSVNVAVNPNLYNPVAVAESYTMYSGNPASTLNIAGPGVLANDTDADGNALTAVNFSLASSGTVAGNANGSFAYTPAANYTGAATFTYQAFDGLYLSAPATVTVNVLLNHAPVAVNDGTTQAPFATVARRTTANNATYVAVVLPNVLSNDTDQDTAIDPSNRIDPATVTITNISGPVGANGATATVNPVTGAISYKPPVSNSNSNQTISYRVSDTFGASSTSATVRIRVQN